MTSNWVVESIVNFCEGDFLDSLTLFKLIVS